MSEQPTVQEIEAALSESGYLLEQETASILETLDFFVWTNKAYKDQDEGKSREIDVMARRKIVENDDKKISAWTEVIAECKKFSHPMVFVGRTKSAVDKFPEYDEFEFSINQYIETLGPSPNGQGTSMRHHPAFYHLKFNEVHWYQKANEKAVQFCRLERKGKNWKASHAGMYESLFLPMAKALKASKRPRRGSQWKSGDWAMFKIFVPIVIVSNDIYFTNQSKGERTLEKRDYVTIRREIKNNTLECEPTLTFVTLNSLLLFLKECIEPLEAHLRKLLEEEPDYVFQSQIPSSA